MRFGKESVSLVWANSVGIWEITLPRHPPKTRREKSVSLLQKVLIAKRVGAPAVMASCLVVAASATVRFLSNRTRDERRARRVRPSRHHAPHIASRASSSDPENNHAVVPTPVHLALKEWSAVVAALASGEQTVLFRKGGLMDMAGGGGTRFTIKAPEMALFPTNYHPPHEDEMQDLQARPEKSKRAPDMKKGEPMPLRVGVRITGAWQTTDVAVLEALSAHHVWTAETLSSRMNWKPAVPITVIELRAFAIDDDEAKCVLPPDLKKYGGCASWIDLPIDMKVRFGKACLSDAKFAEKQKQLRSALEKVKYEKIEY